MSLFMRRGAFINIAGTNLFEHVCMPTGARRMADSVPTVFPHRPSQPNRRSTKHLRHVCTPELTFFFLTLLLLLI
jgi:hypothetical protein